MTLQQFETMETRKYQRNKAHAFAQALRLWDDTKADVQEMLDAGTITGERAQELLEEVAERLGL